MLRGKTVHLILALALYSTLSVFGQWSAVDSGTTNNLNRVHLLDSGIGFVVGDAGTILKTTDVGATWAPLTSGTANGLHDIYFFDASIGVAVGEQGLILRTTDGGAGWQGIASGVTENLHSVSFSGVNGISGGDSQTILYSTDSGASWQPSQTGLTGFFRGAQMLSAATGFVAGENGIFEGLVGRTTDGGASWIFHNFLFNGHEGGCNDVFFLNQNTGVVSATLTLGKGGALARTTDGGLNWSASFHVQPIQGVAFPTAASGFAVGWEGRILHSTDAGITWTDQISGTSVNLNDVSFASDGLRGIAIGQSGTILRTTNGGEPSPTPTPRFTPTPRPRPTPVPRPTHWSSRTRVSR
jgi:photosystem II stability/assembly factor-like uncharacterized protein